MRVSLSSPVRKSAFLGGCIAAGVLVWALCWQALAEYWVARTGQPGGQQSASRIQPLNALYPQLLGRDAVLTNPAEAVSWLEQSVQLNPHASAAWLDLSRVYGVLGDREKQHDAISRALAVDPRNVDVEWEGSLFLFQAGDVDGGLKLVREAITNDPGKSVSGIQAAYHATRGDVARTLQAVPSTAMARLQLLRWLVESDRPSAADAVWPSLVASDGKLEPNQLFFYIDSLVSRRNVTQAQSVWKWLVLNTSGLQQRMEPGNLVVNGDFEGNLLNGGFAWRYFRSDGVSITMDTSVLHSGTRSLLVEFDADRVADAGIYEWVPVEPATHYTLRAFAKSEELESANGARLAVTDYYSQSVLVATEEILGSSSWREVSGEFFTAPDARLVRVSLVRSPALGRIRGKVWLDDVHLEKRP